jgi:putative transposase
MPQSLTQLLIHIVFSTRQREPLILDSWRPDLHAFIGEITRNRRGHLLAVGGIEDHMHLLTLLPATWAVSDYIRDVKANSSHWRRDQGDAGFGWQRGYGAFSVSPSMAERVRAYIRAQREHHQKQTFEDEYRELLRKCGVEYDERYAWD